MFAFAAVFLLAVTNPPSDLLEELSDDEVSEMEWIFEGEESDLPNEAIVYDDSLLIESGESNLEE